MNDEIMKLVRERGLLLEKDIYDILSSFGDVNAAKNFLEGLERYSGQKILTKALLTKNVEYVQNAVGRLSGESKNSVERTIIKMGISFGIRQEQEAKQIKDGADAVSRSHGFKVLMPDVANYKKLEVADFTGHFRARYQQIQRILMQRPDLPNLVSISKISSERQNLCIIGMVKEKRVTKNKNLIITFEDLTGEIAALVKADREEIYRKAEELQMDDVVAIKCSGNRDLLFVYEIYFPDAFLPEKTRFNDDISAAFISDTHCGSERHLGKSFNRFIEWLNSGEEEASKIKYLFIVGDNVDGVGIFPSQESLLTLKSMKEQYALLASYLKRVPKQITMFMCPGQHDATRVAEPQPIPDKKYAAPIYEIENLVPVTNPCVVKLVEGAKEFKVLMYHGASIHPFIDEIAELREMKAHRTPAKAVKHMLKRRHLAPMHGVSSSIVYIPNAEKDPLVISEVPDILCTGEVHRLDVENYNGVLIITGSCWQAQTPFEEKVGNIPDPCKVPVFNLRTRELKVFDFSDEAEMNKDYNGGKTQ